MKPKNFPQRRLRRQARALWRIERLDVGDGRRLCVPKKPVHHHAVFVLYGKVPIDYVEPPTDINLRIGAARRKENA